jgi:hypothetical protein
MTLRNYLMALKESRTEELKVVEPSTKLGRKLDEEMNDKLKFN